MLDGVIRSVFFENVLIIVMVGVKCIVPRYQADREIYAGILSEQK